MKSLILILVSLLCTTFLPTRGQTTHGTMMVTEGLRYMAAFPQVWAEPTEKPMPQPMQLLISSKTKTTVRIQTPASINPAAKIDKVFTVEANKVLKVPISTDYMNSESQVRSGLGISIVGESPISVSTYQAWQGNGEMARHLPIESWGTSYYSMNFYQDRFGFETNYHHRPNQILIISSEDSTIVALTPTVNTEGGVDLPSIAKGTSQSVLLMKGETFLIRSLIDTLRFRDQSTDLSGTYITSTKPIGIVSGHTKGAIMRMPDLLPPTGSFAAEGRYVRNNVHEAMHPTNLAGTTFITVPIMYTPTRVLGQGTSDNGIDNDRGDVIRVVGLEDGTTVRIRRSDHPGFITKFILNKGESRLDTALEYATNWVSDKPILMGQYGKSYAKLLPPKMSAGTNSTESPQGHLTVECGMPMLQMVPPIDRWITHAVLHAPEGMDNFFNIVFKASEVNKIKIDGHSLATAFDKSMRLLTGTEYAYIRTPLGSGDHVVESADNTVRWMAWSYSSLDGLQAGRACGEAVGIDLTTPCGDDSLFDIAVSDTCGQTTVTSWVTSSGCGSIYMIHAVDLKNATLTIDEGFRSGDSIGVYRVKVIDSLKSASASVRTVSRSGDFIDRVIQYVPDSITSSKSRHDFGAQVKQSTTTDTLTIRNPYPETPIMITEIAMANGDPTFTLSGFSTPYRLVGRSFIRIVVSCRLLSDDTVRDTLVVRTNCREMKLTEYSVRARVDTTTSVTGEAATTGLSFTVTPQPTNETATLTLTTIERGAATIELIDLLGNVITSRTEQVTSSPQSFVIGGMNVPSGTYSVRVTASGRQATAQIIIAR
ncbi:MAG: T9SS type A sorting domain-containing protein [Ignavibacteria bacterium]|nr:T9SS type A sorting domain-containing protein [Ignavibacteria bacterium]